MRKVSFLLDASPMSFRKFMTIEEYEEEGKLLTPIALKKLSETEEFQSFHRSKTMLENITVINFSILVFLSLYLHMIFPLHYQLITNRYLFGVQFLEECIQILRIPIDVHQLDTSIFIILGFCLSFCGFYAYKYFFF